MARRPRCLLLLTMVVIAMVASGVWMFWPRSAITRANAARIQVGMTVEEVEAILGGPARDESTGPCRLDPSGTEEGHALKLEVIWMYIEMRPGIQWRSNSVVICVHEGREGQDWRVTEIKYVPMQRTEESPLDMLRRWFGL
jgi:hypothetical protein